VTITDEMVDAGARALRDAFLIAPARKEWHQIPEEARKRYRIEARACLRAALAEASP
jgi:hypothetical protein